jgi:hypothetical protein
MPDSVLMPAPVNALMARTGRASWISAETSSSPSSEAFDPGRIVNACNPSSPRADHAP